MLYALGQECFVVFDREIDGHKTRYLTVNWTKDNLVRFQELGNCFFVDQGTNVLQEIGEGKVGTIFKDSNDYLKIRQEVDKKDEMILEITNQLVDKSISELKTILDLL